MIRKSLLCLVCFLFVFAWVQAQDGLDLPTPLYLLSNDGRVQRIGLGSEGISVVTPEDEFVVDFGVAPDGNWLAYRTQQNLTLRNIYTGEQTVIDDQSADLPPSRGRGDTIAWSPAGDMLAYTTPYGARIYANTIPEPVITELREGLFISLQWSPTGAYLAAEAGDNIWWLYRRDRELLILTSAIPSSIGLAWISNTEVIFAPADGGLVRMNLAAGNAQTILLDSTWNYSRPGVRLDGTLLVFGRQKGDETVPEGSGRLIGLAPNAPRIENLSDVPVELNNLRWAPGAQLAVALRGGVMALVLPTTGQGLTLPIADVVAFSWGPPPLERVNGVELTANGYFLAADGNDIDQIWRLPANGSPPELLTGASADITAYAVSSDSRLLVYASDSQLWQQNLLTNTEPEQLTAVGASVSELTLSPDSSRVAYIIPPTEADAGVWLAGAPGSPPQRILTHDSAGQTSVSAAYTQPAFAPNINGLLLTRVAENEPEVLVLLDLTSLEALQIGVASRAVWLSNGSVLAYNRGMGFAGPTEEQNVYRIDPADPAQAARIATIPQPARIITMRDIAAVRARIVVGSALVGPRALSVVDMLTTTGAITGVGTGGFMVNPLLSPDGRFLVGQTHDGGALTIKDLQTGRQVILNAPPHIMHFSW
ncbi:MAG: hypothetical protein J0L63_09185 [Anaerolineae bacterium]|nr:hypothetical protein [Anaerolineae bacterium]